MTTIFSQRRSTHFSHHIIAPAAPVTMNLNKPPVAFLILCLMFVSACSNGRGRYSCGVPDGPTCLSALQVYDTTDSEVSAAPDRQQTPRRDSPAESKDMMDSDHMRVTADVNGQLQLAIEATAPTIEAIPEREPARIMRIWIAPWQDANGDLIDASRRYAEIVPAKWRAPAPKPRADHGIKLIRLDAGAPLQKPPVTTTDATTLSR